MVSIIWMILGFESFETELALTEWVHLSGLDSNANKSKHSYVPGINLGSLLHSVNPDNNL